MKNDLKKRVVRVCFGVCLGLLLAGQPGGASAQNQSVPAMEGSSTNPAPDNREPDAKALDNRIYETLTLKNLFQIYWKTPLLSLDDDKAIEEYLRISECKVYRDSVNDDFKWPGVLKATRQYLSQYRMAFADRFEIIQPIALGRYDTEKSWFQIMPETQYLNVIRMQIADYVGYRNFECSDMPRVKVFPMMAYVRFSRPFSITYIPMNQEFAREYLKFIKTSKVKKLDINGRSYERPAYVRFRISLSGLMKNEGEHIRGIKNRQKSGNDPYAPTEVDFIGTLDSYDIFADREMKMPLMSWVNDNKNIGSDQRGGFRRGR